MNEPAARPLAAQRTLFQFRTDALTSDWARTLTMAALALVLLSGAYLRLTHNNWDANTGPWDTSGVPATSSHLHPDERFLTQISLDTRAPSSIANFFDTDTSPLNPYNIQREDGSRQSTFVYGTLPLFLNKFIATNLSTFSLGYFDDYDTYDRYHLSGRALAGMLDVLTIVVVFFIGRELANRRVGLLAALLYAFAPFAIQNSHFFIVDPFVTFFATVTILFAVRSAKEGGWRNYALAGTAAGLAAASKITAIALLPVVLLAIGIYVWPGVKAYLAPLWTGDRDEYARARDGTRLDASVSTFILGSGLALLAAFVAFRIAMPYAFNTPSLGDLLVWRSGHLWRIPLLYPDIMNQHWIQDQVNQENLLGGAAFPPNVQWIGRAKWLWPLQQMISWGMGPALGVTAWAGVLFAAAYAFHRRIGVWLVPLAWVLGYFAVMGAQFSLYMRYFLPLYPTLAVFAAFVLYQTWRWASSDDPLRPLGAFGRRLARLRPAIPVAGRAAVVTVAVFTVLAGLAFFNIYRSPVTRIEASKWMYENVPAGSVIGHEHWDDNVPFRVGGVDERQYGHVDFENFDGDSPQRVQELLADIEAVDYIALASGRLSETIPRVPAIWPVTSRYYEALESGELGFEKVAEFTSPPSLFGREFDDTGSEESFTVYDHPKVVIYEKTDAYSYNRAVEVLHADQFVAVNGVLPKDAAQNALLFRPEVLAEQKAGGTWSEIFDPGNFINQHPLLFWLLTMEVAAFALVPLAIVGFRALPDRGFLLTKPLGILGLAYFAYAPAAFAGIDYTRAEIAGALALMALAGIAAAWFWRDEVVPWVRERWRFLLIAESVFLLTFLGAYWLRLQNPDLWHPVQGGEKPMDFAYLNGVIRTTDLTQGPIDPWHAGGYLNYYWFGQFIAATVTKLTGVVPEVAYNLIVPMFFALAAAATFSVTYNLAEATRRLVRRRPDGMAIGVRGPVIAALFAVFLVLIAGNLKAVQVLERALSVHSTWQSDIPVLGGAITILGGFWAIATGDASLNQLAAGGYDWWAPSRALNVLNPGAEVGPITEFPFWTFLFADLHAHLMAIPFSLAAIGVALGAALNFTRLNPPGPNGEHVRARHVSSWAMVVVLAVIVGALRWINSWDYPPFLLLGAAALIIGELARERRFTLRAVSIGAGKALVMGALSYLFFATIAKNYSQAYNGFHQSDQTTALTDYFSHFGILLFLAGGLVLFFLYRALTRQGWLRAALFGRARRREASETMPVMVALVLAGASLVWVGTTQRWGVTTLAVLGLAAVVVVALRELRRPRAFAPVLLFVYAMIALGLGLSGGVEVLTLDGDVGRMNTVFKFYLHVWMLWGIAGAFALWYIFAVARPHEAFLRRIGSLNASLVTAPRYAFAGVVAILLVMSLTYPYFGTRARIHDRFNPAQGTGNDGLEFMLAAGPYDNSDPSRGIGGVHHMEYTRDAITWVRENIDGSPTAIEAVGPSYRSLGSRFAIYTGLPTVIGWGFHQQQQRVKFGNTVTERVNDVAEFYSTTDVGRAREIIRKYDIEWVFVGDEERFNYPDEGIEKFYNGLDGSLELAYQNAEIQIWHVIPDDELATRR